MRWILWSITVLMLLLGAVVIAGGLVARAHLVARTATLAAPPEAVFAAIADIEGMAAWRPEVVGVERVPGAAGAYRVLAVRGPATWAVLEARPPAHLVARIEGAGPGFEGTWTFDLASASGGTRLTVTERGEIENPVFRFLSRFVVGYGHELDAYLDALARHLGQAPARDS